MEEDRMPKNLHSRTGRDETKRKTQERMERRSGKRFSSVGSEKMERVGDSGEVLFDMPKPTAGCSANGLSVLTAHSNRFQFFHDSGR
jgi:hypothetical protein